MVDPLRTNVRYFHQTIHAMSSRENPNYHVIVWILKFLLSDFGQHRLRLERCFFSQSDTSKRKFCSISLSYFFETIALHAHFIAKAKHVRRWPSCSIQLRSQLLGSQLWKDRLGVGAPNFYSIPFHLSLLYRPACGIVMHSRWGVGATTLDVGGVRGRLWCICHAQQKNWISVTQVSLWDGGQWPWREK